MHGHWWARLGAWLDRYAAEYVDNGTEDCLGGYFVG